MSGPREGPGIDPRPAQDVWALRSEALLAAQDFSGEIWTDYNIHDPGVMMLEQAAYAATEIAYRFDRPMTDRLADADGCIDYARLRLAPAAEVMRMRPVTAADLSAVLSGADPATILKVTATPRLGAQAGLYDIHVIPVRPDLAEAARKAVKIAYAKVRNLCEDVAEIRVATPVPCTLALHVEYQRHEAPKEILREAMRRCRLLLVNRPRKTAAPPFDDPVRQWPGWTEIGPGVETTAPLYEAVATIPGVVHVNRLEILLKADRDEAFNKGDDAFSIPLSPNEYLALDIGGDVADIQMTSRGLTVSPKVSDLQSQLSLDNALPVSSAALPSPVRQGRRLGDELLPIAHELPAPFLAGPEKAPSSAQPQMRSAAATYRSYLRLVDGQLDALERGRAGIASLFSESLEPAAEGCDADDEDWIDRKSRALDHLLALYGESFTQSSLHRMSSLPAGKESLENKRRLLRAVSRIHMNRGALDGFGEKLEILLGIPEFDHDVLTRALSPTGLAFGGEDSGWLRMEPGPDLVAIDPMASPSGNPPALLLGRVASAETLRAAAVGKAWRIAERGNAWHLGINTGDWADRILAVGGFASRKEAEAAAANISACIAASLKAAMDAVHDRPVVIEDILLRGTGGYTPMTLDIAFPCDGPAEQKAYRELAEETVGLICPAHILSRCHWLPPNDLIWLRQAMKAFDGPVVRHILRPGATEQAP